MLPQGHWRIGKPFEVEGVRWTVHYCLICFLNCKWEQRADNPEPLPTHCFKPLDYLPEEPL